MFKIEKPIKGEDEAYAKEYAAKLLPLVNAYLGGKVLEVAVKKRGTVHVAVDAMSLTRRFLQKIAKQEWLEKFLLMSPAKQVAFINYLEGQKYPNDLIFKRLLVGTYKKYKLEACESFDHFNEIVYDIFVNGVYDGVETFDKRDFIKNSGLRVCPYCGMEYIKPTNRTKKQIDHFLPKRKYPFLALCYYNLIPSCDTCNESPNKGQKNPIEENLEGKTIMNPYLFNEESLRFHLYFNGMDIYNDNNFNLKVGFSKANLRDGYDYFFDLNDRYEEHCEEVAQDYRRLMDIKALPFYDTLGIEDVRCRLFSYGKGMDNPKSQLFYKMRNDIFKQFLKKRTIGDFYTKASGSNTECLA